MTNTLPLHVEILYNEYNFQAAFAVASLLALLALVTLVAEDDRRSGGSTPRRRDVTASRAAARIGMSIEVQHVTKRFGSFVALDDVSFTVPPGELVALLGPSGSRQDDAAADHRRARARRTRARCCSKATTRPSATRAIAASGSCSSTTRCSGT